MEDGASGSGGWNCITNAGTEKCNNQYNIGQQDSVAHLAPVCVAVTWLSDLKSVSIGDGVGGLEVRKRESNLFLKV